MKELTPIQTQVLAGLIAGGSIAAVAREHKIHRATIYNWRHDHPAFNYALKDARRRQQSAMFDAAQELASRAFETLGGLLGSQDDRMKLRAANAILRTFASPQNLAKTPEPSDFERVLESDDRDLILAALPEGLVLPEPDAYPDLVKEDPVPELRWLAPQPEVRHNSTQFDMQNKEISK